MTFYVEPCIMLHVLQQIKKTIRGLSVVVPVVETTGTTTERILTTT